MKKCAIEYVKRVCSYVSLILNNKNTVPEIKVIENSAFPCASRGSNPGHPD